MSPVPADGEWSQTWFASGDGTMLHADVFLPKDRKPIPTGTTVTITGGKVKLPFLKFVRRPNLGGARPRPRQMYR